MNPVTVSARGAERLRAGHPWVYRSDLSGLPDEPGIVALRDARDRPLGWALVNPRSELTARLLRRGEQPAGPELLEERLHLALDLRERLAIDGDACRLVHAEADGLPGLVVDRYADVLVVQNGSAALEPHLDRLLAVLLERLGPSGVLARFDGRARELEGLPRDVFEAYGTVPERLEVREGRVRYLVDPWTGQKTGAFLDQRENRLALGRHAHGLGLDVFAYHGSFGLHLALECERVECLDSSGPALERALENARLNGLENLTVEEGNAFELLRARERSGRRYGAISLDPPAFAKARRDLDAAYRAYKEVNLRAMRLLEPGGVLGTASCSYHLDEPTFYLMLRDAAADAGRTIRVLERRGQAADHPELLNVPETRYLKFAILQAVD